MDKPSTTAADFGAGKTDLHAIDLVDLTFDRKSFLIDPDRHFLPADVYNSVVTALRKHIDPTIYNISICL